MNLDPEMREVLLDVVEMRLARAAELSDRELGIINAKIAAACLGHPGLEFDDDARVAHLRQEAERMASTSHSRRIALDDADVVGRIVELDLIEAWVKRQKRKRAEKARESKR